MKTVTGFILLWAICSCKTDANSKDGLLNKAYLYVKVDTAIIANKHSVYVPVYSHIYSQKESQTVPLTVTLSIRNTSYADSFYVTQVLYYGSRGELLRQYLDSTVMI